MGYGFLLSNFLNKNLLKYNLGYIGILGLLALVLLSFSTIFFVKHGFIHNTIVHFIGLTSFIFFFKKLKLNKDYILLIILIFFLSSSLFILKNHDDFSNYHLTYALGLTENKIQFGLGNLSHGLKNYSSLFYLNSIIFLPYIQFYLFHSIALITLIFVNFICLKFIFDKKEFNNFNYIYIFYLLIFSYINVKFYRIGEYGTDIAAQLIVLILVPLFLNIIKKNLNKSLFTSNVQILILLICYLVTVKTYFVVYSLFLILTLFLFYNKSDFIKLFFKSRVTIVAGITFVLFSLVNLAYNGCVVYPLKETCFSKTIPWALSQKEVQRYKIWVEGWSKGAASPHHRTENSEEYIKGFNWLKGWVKVYFFNKGLENLVSILFLSILFIIIFSRNKKISFIKYDKNIFKIQLILLVLFFEWFYQHPSLRYGGYSLLASLIFLPTSILISNSYIEKKLKQRLVASIIIISLLVFNGRNIIRINKELKLYNSQSFPYFYVPKGDFILAKLSKGINIYIPKNIDACWATKTPCAAGADQIKTKIFFGFNVFLKNKQ